MNLPKKLSVGVPNFPSEYNNKLIPEASNIIEITINIAVYIFNFLILYKIKKIKKLLSEDLTHFLYIIIKY